MTPQHRRSAAVDATDRTADRRSGANLAMIGCCLALVALGVALLLFAPAGPGSFSGSFWWLLLPILGCGAMHFVLHRSTGQSCQSRSKGRSGEQE